MSFETLILQIIQKYCSAPHHLKNRHIINCQIRQGSPAEETANCVFAICNERYQKHNINVPIASQRHRYVRQLIEIVTVHGIIKALHCYENLKAQSQFQLWGGHQKVALIKEGEEISLEVTNETHLMLNYVILGYVSLVISVKQYNYICELYIAMQVY